jgi:adenylate dimethylallyltransferase
MTPSALPTLHLVLGPTGSGKTGFATRRAAESVGCSVVSLDRFQGHREIAVGSGRPSTRETRGVHRIYLSTGPFSHGPAPAPEAFGRLRRVLRGALAQEVGTVVLEGGSLSLLACMADDLTWTEGWQVGITICEEKKAGSHESAVSQRVEMMVGSRGNAADSLTLMDELADLSGDPHAVEHANGVIGYHEALMQCAVLAASPRRLAASHARAWRNELADSVAAAHLAYASEQRRAVSRALPKLAQAAESVDWRGTV